MISVQNHQQPLSGNKLRDIARSIFFALIVGAILVVSSCSPKTTGVLRNPEVYGGSVGRDSAKGNEDDPAKVEEDEKKSDVQFNQIALLLPFQLQMISGQDLAEEDVKRSALALDFYQGFQLGVEEASKKSGEFHVKVIDTEDDEMKTVSLAATPDIQEASLIVGPVYPREIQSFARGHKNSKVLQINPLAASMPTEFNIPNLVSITPPIRIHLQTIAKKMAEEYRSGDAIVVFDGKDDSHRQFIEGFQTEIQSYLDAAVEIKHVTSLSQLEEHLSDEGTTLIITGVTKRSQLRNLITGLDSKVADGQSIRLFGHPLWTRYDFSPYRNFHRMNPTITSESHLKAWSTEVQAFQREYKSMFKVDPSEYSYKGYDAGLYFVNLLNKYGEEYADKVAEEDYQGIFSNYQFRFNPEWGYVNEGLKLKTYRNGSFQ
ncbi:MAG: ABC transporter substrate-binding protein [Sphingobacterium sp.]